MISYKRPKRPRFLGLHTNACSAGNSGAGCGVDRGNVVSLEEENGGSGPMVRFDLAVRVLLLVEPNASWTANGFDGSRLIADFESEDVAIEANTAGGVCDSDESHYGGNDCRRNVHAWAPFLNR